MGCEGSNHSHKTADTPESLRSCLGCLGDRDASWENKLYDGPSHSHTAADTLESLRSCLGRLGDRDAPWENKVCIGSSHSHTAADTPESPRSCLGCLGDRDAPWENEDTQGPATSTQQPIHLSPSGPAWAARGIGTRVCTETYGYLTPTASGDPTASELGAE